MSDPFSNRLRKSLKSWEVESNLSKKIIEKSQLLFKKHVEKSLKLLNIVEKFDISLEEKDINGYPKEYLDNAFYNKFVYKEMEKIYKKVFPDDSYNILEKNSNGNIDLFNLYFKILKRDNKDHDAIEYFDNIKKLHHSFYLWLDKFGLVHYFEGSWHIIDLGHIDFHISEKGEIRFIKLNNQEFILLNKNLVENLLIKEKEIIQLRKQNSILKQLIILFGVTIIMLILSLL